MGLSNNPSIRITVFNIKKNQTKTNNMKYITGDARDLKRFTNKEFDIVFSHSLLEHLENYKSQKKCASEIQRVGKYFFVQTPNKYFFLEPHYLLPFFFLIPKRLQAFYVQYMSIKWWKKRGDRNQIQKHIQSIRLLNEKEIYSLFPKGIIYKEQFLGITKSLTVTNMS